MSAYQVSFAPSPKRIRVSFGGEFVADSNEAMILSETGLAPTFYFPSNDVRFEFLEPSDYHTHCPFKGNATYWNLKAGDRSAENVIWSYEDPYEEGTAVKGYIAFDWDAMDAWHEDEEQLSERQTVATVENPYVDWLVRKAWKLNIGHHLSYSGSGAVVRGANVESWSAAEYRHHRIWESFAEQMLKVGLPLSRLGLLIRTLHPQIFAVGYDWLRDGDGVKEYQRSHEILVKSEYLESPYVPILDGVGGVRRRLDGPDPNLDFPVLKEYRERGATDYAAMPLKFSDGQINILTLVTSVRLKIE